MVSHAGATEILAAYIQEKKRSIACSRAYGYDAVPAYWEAHWDAQLARLSPAHGLIDRASLDARQGKAESILLVLF